MNTYIQKASAKTPHIDGSVTNGTLHISGRCCPEECVSHFHPLMNWMKLFQMTESKDVTVIIELEYINTSSALVLVRLLREIKNMIADHEVSIRWIYNKEDRDMREVGKDFQYVLGEIIQLEAKVNKAS